MKKSFITSGPELFANVPYLDMPNQSCKDCMACPNKYAPTFFLCVALTSPRKTAPVSTKSLELAQFHF